MAQDRFAREHGCPNKDSQVAEISNLVFKVDGCSKTANYVCDMKDSLARCLLESSVAR
jgi:hypothetical protein